MKTRLTIMPALLLWTSTAPVFAETLSLPGVNVNLNLGPVRAHVNVTPPAVPVNLPVNVPRVTPPINVPMPSMPVSMPTPVSLPSMHSMPSLPSAVQSLPVSLPSRGNLPRPVSLPSVRPNLPTDLTTRLPVSLPNPHSHFVFDKTDSNVMVSRQGNQTRILNLTAIGKSVTVEDANGKSRVVKIDPGTELVTSKEPLAESDVKVGDGVARRNIAVNGNIATAEVDFGSLLKTNGELRRLVINPATAAEKKLGNTLLKTAASLLTIRGGDGFEQTPPPVQPPPVAGGGGNNSVPPTVNTAVANIPTQPETPAPIASQATVNQSTVGANPRTTNTFDQTRPILTNDFSRVRARHQEQTPRRIAQVPPLTVEPPPTLRVPLLSGLLNGTATEKKTEQPAVTKATPNTVARGSAGRRTSSPGAGNGAHSEVAPHGVLGTVHSQLQQTVKEHPTLAILLIALFGLMCAIMGALAVGFYKSRQEINRLNRGLQAKVAELNELNDELTRARDKAIEGSRMKSEFVANISHEIRTPITAVLGMIGLLREGDHEPRESELIKMLDESARSLLNVINDILDFSKIEAGMLMIQSVDFRVADVARDVTELMAGSAKDKNIGLNLNIDPNADGVVRGDPFRLRQVLLNLVGNAIKFTQTGAVTLLVQAEHDGVVSFHIKDTGIGISEEARNRLFQPFSQADGTTTRRFGGTGLGLSISRRLVELMGGRIDFSSEVGQGSHFWFSLPFDKAESEPVSAPEVNSVPPVKVKTIAPRRILVAEDSTVLQRIVVHQLKKLHYDVVLVSNGAEAVEAIKTGRFDLVLMDWQMPQLDGIQATKQIRELPEAGTVPIIAMTANAMEGDRLSCLNAGMNDYISKPFTIEQLQKAVELWLPKPDESEAV